MRTKSLVIALAIAIGVGYLATPALAQTIFGTILGRVTDPSGAILPNVVVTITNQGEGISREVRTDAQGNYLAENQKGRSIYSFRQGNWVREIVLTDIRLDARQSVRADLSLTMGSAEEKVTVEANAELVNTESQAISASITVDRSAESARELPWGRKHQPVCLAGFSSGRHGRRGWQHLGPGNRHNQVEYSVDGISTNNIRFNGPQKGDVPLCGEHCRNEGAGIGRRSRIWQRCGHYDHQQVGHQRIPWIRI